MDVCTHTNCCNYNSSSMLKRFSKNCKLAIGLQKYRQKYAISLRQWHAGSRTFPQGEVFCSNLCKAEWRVRRFV